jgi:hypothetical protein
MAVDRLEYSGVSASESNVSGCFASRRSLVTIQRLKVTGSRQPRRTRAAADVATRDCLDEPDKACRVQNSGQKERERKKERKKERKREKERERARVCVCVCVKQESRG